MPFNFNNILIANRGEIALRILRTLRKSGIASSGIYSEDDKISPWITQCDQAWSVGEGQLSETYLNIEKIISAARQSGADAIHPGYGFLSENFRFANACLENNIVFIGPSPETLKIAGDKLISHDIAASLDITVPRKITGTPDELLAEQHNIVFPVLAKTVAGGGGKGIRLLRKSEDLKLILKTVSDEGLKYFGDERVYLEEYIEEPRHIEVQIVGDSFGNIIHLYERECSVQRRHQKLIEEAPSPGLSANTRSAIINAALRIAKYLNYKSAGTIEFLLDKKGVFYFLEINPRIQVEHGITELLTGIDIVKLQIDIACGNELSVKQEQVKIKGNALEARIYSEDPENDMMPSPGRIHYVSFPSGKGIRIDTGAISGSQILPDYDPLIAKIMVHSNSRNAAVSEMKKAIGETVITGLQHNLALHNLIFSDGDFLDNRLSTGWLEQKLDIFSDTLFMQRQSADLSILCISAALIVFKHTHLRSDSPWGTGFWRNVKQIRFRYGEHVVELNYFRKSIDVICFIHDDTEYNVSRIKSDDNFLEYEVNEKLIRWYYIPEKNNVIRLSDGHTEFQIELYRLRKINYSDVEEMSGIKANTVLAPQPGTIVEIKVSEGQQVSRGDYLLTIESMKLENTVLAVTGGIIQKINIKTGDRVSKNEPLIYLKDTITN